MNEILARLYDYLWGVWRFKWLALVIAWLVAVSGWFWVSQMPDKYVSTARVYVDTNSLLQPLMRGLAIQPNMSQRVSLISKTLLSRPNLEKLVRMADLDLTFTTDAQKEQILRHLKGNISLSAKRGNASLYSISYAHKQRDTAQRVVQSLITVFIESAMGQSRDDGAGAQQFINEQIAEYEKRMVEAERRLAEFKQENVEILSAGGSYYERLSAAKSQLKEVRLQLREMENRKREVQRQLEDIEAGDESEFGFDEFDTPGIASSYDSRILTLESRKDDLLMRYTERHPEVVQIRLIIAELEVDKQNEIDELAGLMEGSPDPSLQASPMYQQVRAMLSETEARVAELRIRAGEYDQRVEDLMEAVNQVPLIEAGLKQLDRDYGVIASKHSQLLNRRESAHMTEEVGQKGSDLKFRIIDPPFSPARPTEPNKVLFDSIVLVVAIGIGLAVAFLLSQLNPLVVSRQVLSELTGLPVFGRVSLIKSPAMKRKDLKQALVFSLSIVGLVAVFATLSVGHTLYII